jgi:hypothetical protein
MKFIDEEILKNIRHQYPKGTRVELVKMDDPFNTVLHPGSKGTVVTVDDIGTIHIAWDCGSSLGVVYGEDVCIVVNNI